MKSFKYIIAASLLFINAHALLAQTAKQNKEAAIKQMLQDKNYTFVAQYANPLGGGHRYLTTDYTLRVKPDSVISYLPYFGVVTFDPPVYPTDDGIKFTSTKFGYQSAAGKKDKYTITITPKDAKYIQRLVLLTSTSGYASLIVTITNRYSISYDGYIVATPDKGQVTAQK